MVSEVVDNIFARRHGRAVPVCTGDKLVGIITIHDVKGLPQERWTITPISEIMTGEPLYTVRPDDKLLTALDLIAKHDINQVIVWQNDTCAGLLGRADIIRYLQMSQELGIRS